MEHANVPDQSVPSPPARVGPSTRRRTRRSVHTINRVMEASITLGGLSVIVSVLGICVYLVYQVVPLFDGGRVSPIAGGAASGVNSPATLVADEYRTAFLTITRSGEAEVSHTPTGAPMGRLRIAPEDRRVTAWKYEPSTGVGVAGLDDGTIQIGQLGFESSLLSGGDVPREALNIPVGSSIVVAGVDGAWSRDVVERVAATEFRRITPRVEFRDPVRIKETGEGSIVAVDYRRSASQEFVVAMRSDGSAALDLITTIRPLGGGKPRTRVRAFDVPLTQLEGRGIPERVFVTGDGSHVLALWDDGLCRRYACRNPQDNPITFAEEIRLLPEGRRVTAAVMQLGGLTLLVGDDAGEVTTVFAAVDPGAWTPDGERLIIAWRTAVSDAAITAFGLGPIDRCLAVGDARGRVAVVHTTSRKTVITPTPMLGGPVAALALTPKRDGIVAMTADGEYTFQDFEAGYPEASVHALFGAVHYEGALGPRHVYQSSTGENTAEIKYGLMPLITGTLKATAMAMLIAVPLAVLAAIYTSEFLSRDTRRLAKPAIEMMASLPSVVLGFLAAIVVAPYVADHLPTLLLAFVVVPAGVLLAGFAWQAIPTSALRVVGGWVKVVAMLAVAAGGLGVASLAAPWIERSLFVPDAPDRWVMGGSSEIVRPEDAPAWVGPRSTMSGDDRRRLRLEAGLYFRDGTIHRPVEPATPEARRAVEAAPENIALAKGSLRGWLDGNFGSPWPGWLIVLVGPGFLASLVGYRRGFGRVIENVSARSSRLAAALIDLAGFASCLLGGVLLAWAGAWGLTWSGLDTRDLIFGPFSQRNTLVVGLLMGFAVVPIIYTIAEDAMSAVPASLRAASLGAGATPWQTALLIVLPVAGSGVFSAVMIGLGRAVGETMIVVMATGNTPSMDFNIFSGFRTLSANIAVEMPEAAHGDTHYRVLFLCGLVLFVLTFAVNTSAEVVRQRFRKRSASL